MKKQNKVRISRRKFIRVAAIVTPALVLAACGEQATSPAVSGLQPTSAPNTAPTVTSAATSSATQTVASTAIQASPTASLATATSATTTVAAPQTSAIATTSKAVTAAVAQVLPATPQCTSKSSQTQAIEEGPYFKPSSPQRTSLIETGISGTKLIVTGYVLSTDCQPIKNALLDFWQADTNGQYDNTGFKLRGHQYTNENGLFYLETVVPGLYPGRTRHIHVKVQAPNQAILTTQLYFPGEARNQTDRIFNQALLLQMQDGVAVGKQGDYNFVLSLS